MLRPHHIRRPEHHGHPTHPTITNETSPHFAEALGGHGSRRWLDEDLRLSARAGSNGLILAASTTMLRG
jgi:hypothetical protein